MTRMPLQALKMATKRTPELNGKPKELSLYSIKFLPQEDHSILHRTLKEWADTYRDGINGKKMIITQHASTPPLTFDRTDFAVRRVLWALTDELAAKHFADLNPVPHLDWIEPLFENRFGYDDLSRFGIVPNGMKDKQPPFSIFNRPTPYTLAHHMYIASMGRQENNWDAVYGSPGTMAYPAPKRSEVIFVAYQTRRIVE